MKRILGIGVQFFTKYILETFDFAWH